MIASFYTANRLGLQLSTAASQVAGGCCAYTQRTYPNGHALRDRVPTASTGPSRPLLHMRLKAFAGPFGVCYQVVTRTTRQLVALSDSHLNSISLHKAAAAVAPSRATTRCPASLLASRRTYTALYRPYPHQRAAGVPVQDAADGQWAAVVLGLGLCGRRRGARCIRPLWRHRVGCILCQRRRAAAWRSRLAA